MQIIKPQSINNLTLLQTNLSEADFVAWAVGTTYTVGERRILVSPSGTVTLTIASPCIITWANHGLANDTPVMFSTTGGFPQQIQTDTVYYVRNRTSSTFEISTKKAGPAVNTVGSQSGVHTCTAQIHHIYESLQAGNLGHYPLISPTWWLLVSSTNRWGMFDQSISAPSASTTSIEVVLAANGLSDAIELLNTKASTVRIIQAEAAAKRLFTVTIASPAVFTRANHSMLNGQALTLETLGALPTGLTALTVVYYVVNRTASTFELSLTLGGASIITTGTQSGLHHDAKVTYDVTHALEINTGINNWDISTAEYADRSFSLSGEDTSVLGVTMSSDGRKIYAAGDTNNRIYEYTLSTPWDLDSIVYSGNSLDISLQSTTPNSIHISEDGSKIYVTGISPYTVYQYNLGTAWDISTATYSTKSMLTYASYGLFLSPDGTKAYIIAATTLIMYRYNLSTAWDISTGTYSGDSLSIWGHSFNALGSAFSPDGTKLFFAGWSMQEVYQYDMPIAWDITTAVYTRRVFIYLETLMRDIMFKPDGSTLYTYGQGATSIHQWRLGENWQQTDLVETDMPTYPDSRVVVSLSSPSGSPVECGELVFGKKLELGGMRFGARISIKDYSYKQQDDFGNYTVVERAFSKRATFLVMIGNEYIDYFQQVLAAYRATPVVYIGSNGLTSTHILGFYVDFSIEIAYPNKSLCSIEVESLT